MSLRTVTKGERHLTGEQGSSQHTPWANGWCTQEAGGGGVHGRWPRGILRGQGESWLDWPDRILVKSGQGWSEVMNNRVHEISQRTDREPGGSGSAGLAGLLLNWIFTRKYTEEPGQNQARQRRFVRRAANSSSPWSPPGWLAHPLLSLLYVSGSPAGYHPFGMNVSCRMGLHCYLSIVSII